MKLTIEIPCKSGLEMEKNLNRAINDFSEALKKKGFIEMELIGHDTDYLTSPIYTVTLTQPPSILS